MTGWRTRKKRLAQAAHRRWEEQEARQRQEKLDKLRAAEAERRRKIQAQVPPALGRGQWEEQERM